MLHTTVVWMQEVMVEHIIRMACVASFNFASFHKLATSDMETRQHVGQVPAEKWRSVAVSLRLLSGCCSDHKNFPTHMTVRFACSPPCLLQQTLPVSDAKHDTVRCCSTPASLLTAAQSCDCSGLPTPLCMQHNCLPNSNTVSLGHSCDVHIC